MCSGRKVMAMVAALIALCVLSSPAAAQITTGAVTGTVMDAQGGVIPGATVVLISETQGTKSTPVVTNGEGQYSVPNIKADIYTVEVTMSSFKTITRKGVRVSGGDRVAVETLTLQVGGATETVNVRPNRRSFSPRRANARRRSRTCSSTACRSPPTHSSNSSAPRRASTAPANNQDGQRIGGGGQDNIMLDGISALDTGNNGLMSGMNLPEAAIAEVKVLTSGYQAEYGRSSGLQVSARDAQRHEPVHGTVYDYERNSDWNANTWAHHERHSQDRPASSATGATRSAVRSASPAATTSCSSSTRRSSVPARRATTTNNYRMPTAARAAWRLLADARQQRRALQPDL